MLPANFHQPTQNEILETLYILDFLTPDWETSESVATERRFLNELALSFPTLCKTPCAFPLPFAEIWKVPGKSGSAAPAQNPASLHAAEAALAAKREDYRLDRAQSNARQQIVAGSVGPAEIVPGHLPFRPVDIVLKRRASHPWPIWLAGAAALLAVLLAAVYFLSAAARVHSAAQPAPPVFSPLEPEASPEPAESSPVMPAAEEGVADAPATPATAPVTASPPKSTAPTRTTPSVAAQEKIALDQKIAASKQRAVSKYPALVVEGSEINLRFVFRYKNLVQTRSPRLQEPDWPEQLAEECAAAAAGTPPKRNAFTQILGSPR